MKKINVGIDLGTTYSAVGTFSKETGRVQIFKNSYDKETTPSVLCFNDSEIIIGDEAKSEQKSGNTNTIAFYKNMMGDENYLAYINGNEYSAEDLSGHFLKELVKDIEAVNDVKIDSAVITVPAYFNDKQREATIRAGRKAGLNVLKIINEPTAAIIAYGLTSGKDKNVLVYDLGGGTFDVTIAHVSGTKIDVLSTNGNHQLGGKDWDQIIIEDIKEQFYSEYGVNIDDYEEDSKELQVKCEEAKKRLSSVPSTIISIQCEGYLGKYEISRESFDDKTYSLLYETILLINNCFDEISEDNGSPFGWKDIDEVVLVGGSTRMPQVRNMIVNEYGKQPITKDINVDTIVATGAAMQAELCVNNSITMTLSAARGPISPNSPTPMNNGGFTLTINNSDIEDITSHGLGMLALASDEKTYINSIIIKKNSKVNKVFSREYNFAGEKLEVYVLQGESRDPYDCDIIGKYTITGMTSGEKNKIIVDFLYNSNGVVEVSASTANGIKLISTKEKVTETIDEIIIRLEKEREEAKKAQQKLEVMVMIDSSGSMSGNSMVKAHEAANQFIDELDLKHSKVSIIEFAERIGTNCHFSNNKSEIQRAINKITPGNVGYGTSASPIQSNYTKYSKDGIKVMVILTDGYWTTQNSEIQYSDVAKKENIIIYAIGIGDADETFLRRISSGKVAKKVDLSNLTQAFKDVAVSIATEVVGNTLYK